MNRIAIILIFYLLVILLTSFEIEDRSAKIFDIPSQTINFFKILGDSSNGKEDKIKGFQISELVTYKEYKEYLNAIRKDSSFKYYQTQLPDSNIGSNEVRAKYIGSSEFDELPVLGISWDNAMNFCRWKTIKENGDSVQFLYRLPNCSEWLAAYWNLSKNNIQNDFNKKYSDWLLNTKFENILEFRANWKGSLIFEHNYFAGKDESLTLKRKLVIGDSYLFQQEKLLNYCLFNYYSTEGYRQVSFRYVKELANETDKNIFQNRGKPVSILEYWGLNLK